MALTKSKTIYGAGYAPLMVSLLDELIVRGRVRETHLVPVGIRGRENARL
jgi:hypothetical protein